LLGDAVIVRTDAGSIYAFNPSIPDAHTTVLVQPNFVSDFAGFTQGSTMVARDDTALRVYFRRDVPDTGRFEIILELGHFTTGGAAANLGPFTLQIFKGGVAQAIPYPTVANPGQSTTNAHFPQMGWGTRWRFNPRPRPAVRTDAQLIALNLVPNFSPALATTFRAADTNTAGGPALVIARSSAYAPGAGNDLNPVGVNENCTLAIDQGGVGGRSEIGVVNEWAANWICNGNADALASMLTIAEVAGGLPWCQRDSSTNWAPVDFYAHPLIAFSQGLDSPPYTQIDNPGVLVPSSGGQWWVLDVEHYPALSYVAYLATGDPFFLENLQFQAAWAIGHEIHRETGYGVNGLDPNMPQTPGFNQIFHAQRGQTRGLAWHLRAFVECYLATPTASLPSWLLPKSYFKKVLDDNAAFAISWGPNYPTDHPTLPQYPTLRFQGTNLTNQYEQGFYVSYLMIALGFAVNQGALSSWKPYYDYAAAMPISWANGTSGWDNRFPAGDYIYFQQPFSNDYDSNPAAFASFADVWNYHKNNAMIGSSGQVWSIDPSTPRSTFPPWAAGAYHCNSWAVSVRSGLPVLPNAGDVVSLTTTGSFTGSPVTVSHTVTSGDVEAMLACVLNFGEVPHPLTDALINGINGNATLAFNRIVASYNNANAGVGSQIYVRAPGLFYVSFNSDGTNSTGGPIIGPITITGSFTTATNNSVYIVPNGDGVFKGRAGPSLFGRPLSYTCGKSGVSIAGPSAIAQQALTADNTTNWCWSPEYKSPPLIVPGGPTEAFPSIGYGGVYGGAGVSAGYLAWEWCALNCMVTAGIAGAPAALANIRAQMDHFYTTTDPTRRNQFNFSIAP
jgi:hypothetical protein